MTNTTRKPLNAQLSQFRTKGEIPIPVFINWLTVVVVPLLAFFAWRSSERGEVFTALLLLGLAVLLGANAALFLFIKHNAIQRWGFILLVTTLLTYIAVQALEDGTAIIWLFVYPPVIFYISEARIGVAACAGGFTALALLFSPLGDALFAPPYSASFRLSMLSALGLEMVICYILDQSRRRSKLGLLKLASEFEYAAKHDALTGLANRREALDQLDTELQRYRRNNRPFSVLLMDIDLFKAVNDNYGHHVGDELINLVAQTLREQCRKVDTLARWGGEEYLALLPETDSGEASGMANRIREAIANNSVTVNQQAVRATISIGVAEIQGAESTDHLLQRADEALYRAKTLGRNRVCSDKEQHLP